MIGKGFYVWQVFNTLDGNIPAIVAELRRGEFTHILVKIADGMVNSNIKDGRDYAQELTAAAQAAGIFVAGWQYVYDTYPVEAAKKAVQRIVQTGVTEFVIDGEAELKGKPAVARAYAGELDEGLADIHFMGDVWLSTYRYPSLHREFPYRELMAVCEGMMPQVYWEQAHNPAFQLQKSFDEWKAMFPDKAFIPTGACYPWNAWKPTADDEIKFLDQAKAMGLDTVNFWVLQQALEERMFEPYNAIVEYEWTISPPPPTEPEFLALKSRTTGRLKLRTGPGTGYPVIETMLEGAVVYPVQAHKGWARVYVKSGQEYKQGWCYANYLERIG